uniref:Uncharacterized protein n=1 Tax=Anguilla anguilla TaxID=7936 RepID=A0A0E9SWX4_ANGAN
MTFSTPSSLASDLVTPLRVLFGQLEPLPLFSSNHTGPLCSF